MAKISFNKLGLKKQNKITTLTIGDQDIEIKQYLPIEEKLDFLTRVVNKVVEQSPNFPNSIQATTLSALEMIYTYTNIQFTEKQKEDFCKTYNLMDENGLIKKILDCIPTSERRMLQDGLNSILSELYTYRNSARGILESLSTDYNNLNLDIESLQEKIKDPESLQLLKDILPLM